MPNKLKDRIQDGVIWRHAAIAAAVAVVLNVIVYFIAESQGWIPDELPSSVENLSLVSTIIASGLAALAAGGLLVLLARNVPESSRLFAMIALVVLVISLIIPFFLAGLDTSLRMTLLIMHVIAGVVIIGLLLRAVRR